jgi:hypothetical protein
MDITCIEGGKIVESWHQEDILGLMQQLGVIPAPRPASSLGFPCHLRGEELGSELLPSSF